MSESELPQTGYAGFACAADPSIALAGWDEFRRCPAGADGLRGVRFRYASGDTMVAGHPVLLALQLDATGRVQALRIETDPAARLYLRKKAFLLGLQARSRFGADGWTCREGAPSAEALPIGDTFVQEHCEKTVAGRRVTVERSLFRRPDQKLKDFVGATSIVIRLAPTPPGNTAQSSAQ